MAIYKKSYTYNKTFHQISTKCISNIKTLLVATPIIFSKTTTFRNPTKYWRMQIRIIAVRLFSTRNLTWRRFVKRDAHFDTRQQNQQFQRNKHANNTIVRSWESEKWLFYIRTFRSMAFVEWLSSQWSISRVKYLTTSSDSFMVIVYFWKKYGCPNNGRPSE